MASKVTQDDILRINELYYKHHVYAEVARQTGFSAATVKRYIIPNWEPPKVITKKFEWKNLPNWKDALKVFRGVEDYGSLCVLTVDERKEIEDLWGELAI